MTPRYSAPRDLAGVTAALADGDGVVVGGGTMVVPDMTHGRTSAAVVVDLSRAGLAGVTAGEDGAVVGAMTTYTDLITSDVPLLSTVASGITGGPQIRNRGTAGGSACYANPASDVPACLVALGARMRLASAGGAREVPAAEFFLGGFRTARRPDEVLEAFVVPPLGGAALGYLKFKLAEGSWPIVTAATFAPTGGPLRIVVGGAAATPVAVDVDRPSVGSDDPAWREHVREAVHTALDAAEPWTDVLAPAAYRRRIAPVIAARSAGRALEEDR
ncbi:FAD binding domain-containing protein [Umezawaea endophytica]|uniref:FAD binding domain-containing protein n=1 Tax=Umezawaea endophytica TaxID=1654476 RepID=A0A9X2VFW5_9PSEU|nr:FAD binding domain-containing protein [Umezawaea endophytica]MCS7475707.1 FAD binding domain-containing protein [Umezawaea endophytica]